MQSNLNTHISSPSKPPTEKLQGHHQSNDTPVARVAPHKQTMVFAPDVTHLTKQERYHAEQQTREGMVIPHTANVVMSRNRQKCALAKTLLVNLSFDKERLERKPVQFRLSYGRLNHICTGPARALKVQTHTKIGALDTWVASILNAVAEDRKPWVLQSSPDEQNLYLTTFTKSQCTNQWIGERVIACREKQPRIVTAFPLLNTVDICHSLSTFKTLDMSNLAALPIQFFPKTLPHIYATPPIAESQILPTFTSQREVEIADDLPDRLDIVSSQVDAMDALMLKRDEQLGRLKELANLCRERGSTAVDLLKTVIDTTFENRPASVRENPTISDSMKLWANLKQANFLDLKAQLHNDVLLFDEMLATFNTAFSNEKALNILKQEIDLGAQENCLKLWSTTIEQTESEFASLYYGCILGRVPMLELFTKCLIDVTSQAADSFALLKGTTVDIAQSRTATAKAMEKKAEHIQTSSESLACQLNNFRTAVDPKGSIWPEPSTITAENWEPWFDAIARDFEEMHNIDHSWLQLRSAPQHIQQDQIARKCKLKFDVASKSYLEAFKEKEKLDSRFQRTLAKTKQTCISTIVQAREIVRQHNQQLGSTSSSTIPPPTQATIEPNETVWLPLPKLSVEEREYAPSTMRDYRLNVQNEIMDFYLSERESTQSSRRLTNQDLQTCAAEDFVVDVNPALKVTKTVGEDGSINVHISE